MVTPAVMLRRVTVPVEETTTGDVLVSMESAVRVMAAPEALVMVPV